MATSGGTIKIDYDDTLQKAKDMESIDELIVDVKQRTHSIRGAVQRSSGQTIKGVTTCAEDIEETFDEFDKGFMRFAMWLTRAADGFKATDSAAADEIKQLEADWH